MVMVKRFLSCIMLGLLLLAGTVNTAHAEQGTWICTNCGKTDNAGNFCSNCGAAKPEQSSVWYCASCCFVENSGAFCLNCGRAKSDMTVITLPDPTAWFDISFEEFKQLSFFYGRPSNMDNVQIADIYQQAIEKAGFIMLNSYGGHFQFDLVGVDDFDAYFHVFDDQISLCIYPGDYVIQFESEGHQENEYAVSSAGQNSHVRYEWVTRQITCIACHGSKICSLCNGTGVYRLYGTANPCPKYCTTCDGKGYYEQTTYEPVFE